MAKQRNLILVGDIPKDATEATLRALFSQYGQIKDIYFHSFPDFLSQQNLSNIQELVQISQSEGSK